MEFHPPSPMGAQAHLLAQLPIRKIPDGTRVEKADPSDEARADMRDANGNEAAYKPPEPPDPDQPVGPPPSFQINVLEMEAALRQDLARQQAERAMAPTEGTQDVTVEEAAQTSLADEQPDISVQSGETSQD